MDKNVLANNKKKKSLGLTGKLLLFIGLPVVVIVLILNISSGVYMRMSLEEETQQELKATCHSTKAMMNKMSPGDFEVVNAKNLKKGNVVMSDNSSLQDVKNETGIDLTIFNYDTRLITTVIKNDGSFAVGTKASDVVIQSVLKDGKEYFDTNVNVVGRRYYGFYLPLKNSDGKVFGMLFAGKSKQSVEATIQEHVVRVSIISTILAVILAIFICIITRFMTKAFKRAGSIMEAVSQGNLVLPSDVRRKGRNDEIGRMMGSVGKLLVILNKTISEVKETAQAIRSSGEKLSQMSEQTSSNANEISSSVEDIATGANSQAEETSKATQDIIAIGTMISNISQKVEELNQSSDDMQKADAKSNEMIIELSNSNDRTTEAMEKISTHVMGTNRSVQSINQAVEMISSIAEQTNLLSLNASIEAARAGENGKGFAVVAGEIQKLAEQSNESAQAIQEIIEELLSASETTVKIMEDAKGVILEQQNKLDKTKECLIDVDQGIKVSKDGIVSIRGSIEDLNHQRDNIVNSIKSLSEISEENAASTEGTTASMEELNTTITSVAKAAEELMQLSVSLEEAMGFFTV